jgi:hypothetical protein
MAGGSVTFQAQNPARSGDKSTFVDANGRRKFVGWTNCTAFVAAMGAQFDSGVQLTGTQVRRESTSWCLRRPARPQPHQVSQARHGVTVDVETLIDFDDRNNLRLGSCDRSPAGYTDPPHGVSGPQSSKVATSSSGCYQARS